MKFFYDLLPVILFFVTFKVAQGNPAAILVSLLQIVFNLVSGKKVEPMLWISVAIILVFGSLTIWLHDEMFIKWKPTILYWVFALILVFGMLTGRNFIKSLLGKQIELPAPAWRKLLLSWIAFFLVVGVLNLVVAYTCSTDFWVNFKLFGLMGLTLLFTLGIGFYIAPFISEDKTKGKEQ